MLKWQPTSLVEEPLGHRKSAGSDEHISACIGAIWIDFGPLFYNKSSRRFVENKYVRTRDTKPTRVQALIITQFTSQVQRDIALPSPTGSTGAAHLMPPGCVTLDMIDNMIKWSIHLGFKGDARNVGDVFRWTGGTWEGRHPVIHCLFKPLVPLSLLATDLMQHGIRIQSIFLLGVQLDS